MNEKNIQLFLDCDGVICNFDEVFVQIVNKMFNKNLPSDFVPNDWYWTKPPVSITQEDSLLAYHAFLKDNGFLKQSFYKEAKEFIDEAKKFSHIDLVTHIPDECKENRVKNLNGHNIHFDRIFTTEEKSKCINQNIIPGKDRYIFVDDKPENCIDVAENCKNVEVFIIKKPYNVDFKHPNVWPINSLLDIALS